MALTATATPASDATTPVAPWWNTVLILLLLAAGSAASAHFHGLPRFPIPGLRPRVAAYIVTLLMEWFTVLLIWWGLRIRGRSIFDLISGRWQKVSTFFKDLGWAVAFLVVAFPSLQLIARLLHANYDAKAILPATVPELILWLLLAATAGFCEELMFRGYLYRQFSGWTGNRIAGMALQGVAFGLAHGYQGWRMMTLIMIFGWMFGALALWRKSLLPGMLAHWLQDSGGGLLGFFSRG